MRGMTIPVSDLITLFIGGEKMIRNLRFIVSAALLIALVAMANASHARAQGLDCRCRSITFSVDSGVACKVTVCVTTPDGARNCVTISPGGLDRLRCIQGATIYFVDCHGNLVPFAPGANPCQIGIGVGPHCCTIDACLETDDAGCTVIHIRPSIVDSCPCL
jgi:hypothetical protein